MAPLCAILIALQVYAPALRGPFVFDDVSLPFHDPQFADATLLRWLSGVRPFLYFSFWLNYQLFGEQTLSYHFINVILHALNSCLVSLILMRLLEWQGLSGLRRAVLATFGGLLFLLHPLQTESVAYIASRSENLTALLLLSALAIFVYRFRAGLSWRAAIWVLLLFGAGCATKEHAVALVPVLLATEFFWHERSLLDSLRSNRKIYVLLGAVAAGAATLVALMLRHSTSAGFGMRDRVWWEYFFTQCRVVFNYIGLFFYPVGQSIDHDVPISHTLWEHGAAVGLCALLLLVGAALWLRNRYRLAAYGLIIFLLFLAPTSSFVPIRDVMAERRMYLPMLGLILVLIELIDRIPISLSTTSWVLGAVLCMLGSLAYVQNQNWANATALWQQAVELAPANPRPYSSLAVQHIRDGQCEAASKLIDSAPPAVQSDFFVLATYGISEDCLGHYDHAVELYRHALAARPSSHVYSQMGLVLQKQGKFTEAFAAFQMATDLEPDSDQAHFYLGGWYEATSQPVSALHEYEAALRLNPHNTLARLGLQRVQLRLGAVADP